MNFCSLHTFSKSLWRRCLGMIKSRSYGLFWSTGRPTTTSKGKSKSLLTIVELFRYWILTSCVQEADRGDTESCRGKSSQSRRTISGLLRSIVNVTASSTVEFLDSSHPRAAIASRSDDSDSPTSRMKTGFGDCETGAQHSSASLFQSQSAQLYCQENRFRPQDSLQ